MSLNVLGPRIAVLHDMGKRTWLRIHERIIRLLYIIVWKGQYMPSSRTEIQGFMEYVLFRKGKTAPRMLSATPRSSISASSRRVSGTTGSTPSASTRIAVPCYTHQFDQRYRRSRKCNIHIRDRMSALGMDNGPQDLCFTCG